MSSSNNVFCYCFHLFLGASLLYVSYDELPSFSGRDGTANSIADVPFNLKRRDEFPFQWELAPLTGLAIV